MTDSMTAAHRAALAEVYTVMDKNGSGEVELRELNILMNKLLSKNVDEVTLGEIMSEITESDQPGTTMSFEHLCAAIAPILAQGSDEVTKRAFAAMDTDGSGCISATELAPLMAAVTGEKLSKGKAEDM